MAQWSAWARQAVARAALFLPDDMPLPERVKAIDAAYPFNERAHWPYKAWLRARKAYLAKFGHRPRKALPESPLERLMRRNAPVSDGPEAQGKPADEAIRSAAK